MSAATITIKQAADLLDMKPSSIRRAISQNRMFPEKVPTEQNRFGFLYVFTPGELERYRNEPKQKGGGRPRKVRHNQ